MLDAYICLSRCSPTLDLAVKLGGKRAKRTLVGANGWVDGGDI